jgi:Probable transposase.
VPNLEKNSKIREKRKQTLLRRRTQEAKAFELKLDKSKISKTKLAILNYIFLEAKWFTNYIIAKGILNFKPHADYKVKTVPVKVCNTFQEREIKVLSSQMKQALIKRLQDNVIALSKLKEKGVKVGRIKFVKAVHSIPLMQYGVTYWVKKDNKMIHIQGIGNFKVSGLDQIPENAELSSANFVERNGDYYLYVTCFLPKEDKPKNVKAIGIDLGVKNQITFSNGVKIQYLVPMSKRLRRLYHFFSRAKPGSRNKEKLLLKIKREFEKQNDKKRDIINKVVHFVTTNYSKVVLQDDNIRSWQKLFGERSTRPP